MAAKCVERYFYANTGQQVRQGETIALMSSTGFATEPNLQFEVHPAATSPEGIKLLVFHRTYALTEDVRYVYGILSASTFDCSTNE